MLQWLASLGTQSWYSKGGRVKSTRGAWNRKMWMEVTRLDGDFGNGWGRRNCVFMDVELLILRYPHLHGSRIPAGCWLLVELVTHNV